LVWVIWYATVSPATTENGRVVLAVTVVFSVETPTVTLVAVGTPFFIRVSVRVSANGFEVIVAATLSELNVHAAGMTEATTP
jgi:hypothetical protein